MKRLLLLLLLLILLMCPSADAGMGMVMMGGGGTAAEVTCTVKDECTGTDDHTATGSGGYIGQLYWKPASNITVCRIGFNIYTDPSGATVTFGIYAMDGANIGDVVVSGSAAISGTGWKYIDVTPTAVSSSTDYIVAMKVDGAAGAIYDSTTTTLDGDHANEDLAKWGSDGVKTGDFTGYDAGVRIYGQ